MVNVLMKPEEIQAALELLKRVDLKGVEWETFGTVFVRLRQALIQWQEKQNQAKMQTPIDKAASAKPADGEALTESEKNEGAPVEAISTMK